MDWIGLDWIGLDYGLALATLGNLEGISGRLDYGLALATLGNLEDISGNNFLNLGDLSKFKEYLVTTFLIEEQRIWEYSSAGVDLKCAQALEAQGGRRNLAPYPTHYLGSGLGHLRLGHIMRAWLKVIQNKNRAPTFSTRNSASG